jgi:tyrosine-protein phosphatase YwqE
VRYRINVFERVRKLLGGGGDSMVGLRARDCHTHVIPGVDDGSRSMEESLAMLRLLHAAGARTVISTSHIYSGRFPNQPDDLRRGFDALVRAASAAAIPLQLELGAEHWLDESLLEYAHARSVLAFGPERYVLFETSTGPAVPGLLFDAVRALADRGYRPLLAHVERYPWLRGDQGAEVLADLRALGVRFQVNRTHDQTGQALTRTGRGEMIASLLASGFIDEVGSDLHRATQDGRPYPMPGP